MSAVDVGVWRGDVRVCIAQTADGKRVELRMETPGNPPVLFRLPPEVARALVQTLVDAFKLVDENNQDARQVDIEEAIERSRRGGA